MKYSTHEHKTFRTEYYQTFLEFNKFLISVYCNYDLLLLFPVLECCHNFRGFLSYFSCFFLYSGDMFLCKYINQCPYYILIAFFFTVFIFLPNKQTPALTRR